MEDDENAHTPTRAANAAHAIRLIVSSVASCSLRHLSRLALVCLPRLQHVTCVVLRRIHRAFLAGNLGGEFDDIAVGIAEVDRTNESVVAHAAHLAALGLALGEHLVEGV